MAYWWDLCNGIHLYFRIQIVNQLGEEQYPPEGEIVEPQKILMVHTRNLVHEPFESTMDVKVRNCWCCIIHCPY